jgi:hypothetical protein
MNDNHGINRISALAPVPTSLDQDWADAALARILTEQGPELRRGTTARRARVAAAPPPRRRLRTAVLATTGLAATFAGIGLSLGGTSAPAFAVTEDGQGAVSVVVHRLEDSSALEAALAEHGIDATVTYVDVPQGAVPPMPDVDGTYATMPSAAFESCQIDDGPGPAMLRQVGDDWALQIPAESPLFARRMTMYVGGPGSFTLAYPSATDGVHCGFGAGERVPG